MENTLNVRIEQRKFTFRSEYDVYTPGCTYHADKKLLSFRDKLQLLAPDGRVLARITSRLSLFRSKYDFQLSEGKVYRFWCEKIWKRVFVCESDEEIYRLYEHKGLKYSIFQEDHRIAAFTKNRVKIGQGDLYEIRMNEDANLVIVICLALTIDASENEDDNASVTVDFGNLGPEDKRYDESWEPS